VIAAITEYWYFSLAFVLVSILTVFVCFKAYQASSKVRRERDSIIERLKYENKTRAAFACLTNELIESAEPKMLFEGIALNIQTSLEKEKDMNVAFENLTQQQKWVYALYYVLVDGERKLSEFFKMNGKPLTDYAGEAVKHLFGCKAYELYSSEYNAYDEDDEETSLIKGEIEKNDTEFALFLEQNDVYSIAGGYIKQNPAQFIVKNYNLL
jgi:hypothetical protein